MPRGLSYKALSPALREADVLTASSTLLATSPRRVEFGSAQLELVGMGVNIELCGRMMPRFVAIFCASSRGVWVLSP